jgi:putative transposase
MPDYRRVWNPGGTFFFTLVAFQRRRIFQDEWARQILREAFQYGNRKAGPFQIDAICLLPDHLHCIWTLPENDVDYSTRWKIIKAYFSRHYLHQGGSHGLLTPSKLQKGEVGVWQRRFWEHMIRDNDDLNRHIDYIHYNPVKHGLAQSAGAWPWSSFHRYVRAGYYAPDWGNIDPEIGEIMGGE